MSSKLGERLGSVALPGIAESVPVARSWAQVVLLADNRSPEDALVVISELAGNAIRHTASGRPGGRLTVKMRKAGEGLVRVEVVDQGAPTIPVPREPDLESLTGRGLWLIDQLSAQWGTGMLDKHHRTVWALIPAPRATSA